MGTKKYAQVGFVQKIYHELEGVAYAKGLKTSQVIALLAIERLQQLKKTNASE